MIDQIDSKTVKAAPLTGHRLLMFELSTGGHYPGYIQHLVRYWRSQQLPGALDVVVTPQFLEQHADVIEDAGDPNESHIQFMAIQPEEEAALQSRATGWTRAKRAFQELDLLQRYAKTLNASHCFIPYFDTRLLPLALGQTLPCSFSGIYFRPTFHYNSLTNTPSTLKEKVQQVREKVILGRVLSQPKLDTLFCLDPFVLKYLEPFKTQVRRVPLADPVQIYPNSPESVAQLRQTLGVEAGRRVMMLFGAIDGRKGIHQLLDAIATFNPDSARKLCLLLVGPMVNPDEKDSLLKKIETLKQTLPVQIVCFSNFVKEREIQPFFQLADVVLAPYQRHVGMSAILVRSAAAQKPVLSSNHGLMGAVTRQFGLGQTVDSTQPSAIARTMTQLLEIPLAQVGDRSKMQTFAAQNSAEQFAQTIFQTIWTQPR
jgi:glycosyltransferase involved in cell wall biosynthesis